MKKPKWCYITQCSVSPSQEGRGGGGGGGGGGTEIKGKQNGKGRSIFSMETLQVFSYLTVVAFSPRFEQKQLHVPITKQSTDSQLAFKVELF